MSTVQAQPVEAAAQDVVTLDDLLLLKKRWGVSVGAIVMRLRALKILDEEGAQLLFKRRSARWGAKSEPGDDDRPPERPRLLRRTIDLLVEENVMPLDSIPRHIGLAAHDIEMLENMARNLETLPVSVAESIIGQRITFGRDGQSRRQAAEIAVLQGGNRGIPCGRRAAVTDVLVEQHILAREHRGMGMGQIAAPVHIAAKARIDQHLPQKPCLAAQRSRTDASGRRLLRALLHRLLPVSPLPVAASGLMVFTQNPGVARRITDRQSPLEQEWLADVVDAPGDPEAREAVLRSVAKTGRLMVADEDYLGFGLTGEIAAIVAENLDTVRLLAPVEPSKRLCVRLNFRDHIDAWRELYHTADTNFLTSDQLHLQKTCLMANPTHKFTLIARACSAPTQRTVFVSKTPLMDW